MQPKLHQTPLMRTTHLAGADSPKTQTTSPLAARCQRFSPNGSALWRPRHRKPRCHRHQSGGIALHGGPTRRRHAARRLRVVQNPHRSQPQVRRVTSQTGAGPLGAKKLARHGPSRGSSATKLAQQATKPQFQAILSAQGELFRACRRRPSSALPISDQAQLVWRAPASTEGLAAVPVGGGRALP